MNDATCTVVAADSIRVDIYDDTVEGNFPGRYTRIFSLREMMMLTILFAESINKCEVAQARVSNKVKGK